MNCLMNSNRFVHCKSWKETSKMLKIKQAVISEIVEHAKEDLPIDACGYLAEKKAFWLRFIG